MSIKCNMSPEDRERILPEFGDWLTADEMDRMENLFRGHLFYHTVNKKQKDFFCEKCHTAFTRTKQESPALFQHAHGEAVRCPICGESVELICDGRIRTGASLKESKCILLIRVDEDGALKLMAGVATREYERCGYDFQPCVYFMQYRRYYLAPGIRQCWKRRWYYCWGDRSSIGEWDPTATIVRAFTPGYMGNYSGVYCGYYNVIGAEKLERSFAKYSGALLWLGGQEYIEDSESYAYLEQYLAAYIDYPQLEFAAKMGENAAIKDLVINGRKNHRIINWKADNPAAFYRMTKQEYRNYAKAGGTTEDLILAKELNISIETELQAKQVAGTDRVRYLIRCAAAANMSVLQAGNYLNKQSGNTGGILTIWRDYLDMAETLCYDLADRQVSAPKHLRAAHDRAAELLKAETDKEANQRYEKRRRPALQKKYEMEWGGMCIRVPESTHEIAREGKELHHCVGGYAKRHIHGKTVILFLRRADDLDTPLVTIEMDTNGKTIRQIHGYGNEGIAKHGKYPEKPEIVYAEFLDVWLKWLAADSPRTSTGKPILSMKQEVKSA